MRICCIIKPPALSHAHAILQKLQEHGVTLITKKVFRYSPLNIQILYDHMDHNAKIAICHKYGDKDGIALLLEFKNLENCLELVGKDSNPSECQPHTLRHMFGMHSKPEVLGDWQWWENAVHRPIDERERLRDLKLIFPEYASSAG